MKCICGSVQFNYAKDCLACGKTEEQIRLIRELPEPKPEQKEYPVCGVCHKNKCICQDSPNRDDKETWEKRFEKVKKVLVAIEKNEWWDCDEDTIKDFIKAELKAKEKEFENELMKLPTIEDELNWKTENEYLDEAIKKLISKYSKE